MIILLVVKKRKAASPRNVKEKIIIRDNNKEQDILNTLDELNFEYNNNQFVFEGNEEDLYNFIKEDYKKLEPFGDIYYSDRLKEKKVYKNSFICMIILLVVKKRKAASAP